MRELVLSLLKVPPDPTPPAGTHESVRVFRAGRNYYRFLIAVWALRQIGVVVGALFALYWIGEWTEQLPEKVRLVINVVEWLGLAGVVAQMPFTFYLVKFEYELRWYIVTDRSLRIRAGVWDIREMTMTFANIQNTSVQQGPLQRLLGLSDVMVRTAGGGESIEAQAHQKGQNHLMHVGFFHGVDNAEEIRDLLKERLRRYRDTGLGDATEENEPDGEAVPGEAPPADVLVAAREFTAEARLLRQQLAGATI